MSAPLLALVPREGPSTSIVLRPYQTDAIDAVFRVWAGETQGTLLVHATGLGKCLGIGTPVLMFDGSVKPVEDVRTGDLLMGPDSTRRLVQSTTRGVGPLFRIVPVKGDPWICNDVHILTLAGNGKYEGEIVDVALPDYMRKGATWRHCHKQLRTGVAFPPQSKILPIDPYFLGVWLGDGTKARDKRGRLATVAISKPDPEIEIACHAMARLYGLQVRRDGEESNPTWHIHGERGHGNPLLDDLRLAVGGYDGIPIAYRTASRDDRLLLLAGLIDTDGTLTDDGVGLDWTLKSENLARDLAFLIRSLGRAAYVKPCRKGCQTGAIGDYFRIVASGDFSDCPARIPRKQPRMRQQIKNVLRTGFSVDPIGVGEYAGFTIDGDGRFLLGDFTITHNTTVACEIMRRWKESRSSRILFLAHRDELIQQAARRIESMIGIEPDIEKAEHRDSGYSSIVVGSIQTCYQPGRLSRFKASEFGLVIVDECFPAGTLIDGKPIETVRVGDIVSSLNAETGRVERRRVARLFCNPARSLVRVSAGDRRVVCTPSHPFFTGSGWKPASLLTSSDMVCYTAPHEQKTIDLRPLRQGNGDATSTCFASHVLRGVQGDAQTGTGGGEFFRGQLSPVLDANQVAWRTGRAGAQPGPGLLLDGVLRGIRSGGVIGDGSEHEPALCVGAHEGAQSHAARGRARQAENIAAGNGMGTSGARWQWDRRDRAPIALGVGAWLADGDSDPDQAAGGRIPDLLQGRHCGVDVDDSNRGGWEFPRFDRAPRTGREENGALGWARVDGVEVLESGGDGTFGGLCPHGLVYNFEVEGTHTYFADGFAVHNCHHAASDSYLRVLEHFASAKRLGLTATPTRKDGKKLGAEWDSIAHEFNLRDAISEGWLVPVRRREVHVSALQLDDIPVRLGDLVESKIEEKVLKDEAIVHSWARGILDAAPTERRILCFTPGVQSSIRLVECLNRYRPDGAPEWASHLDGETPPNDRRLMLARFGRGELRYLSNCGVLLEGYDEPTIDVVAMCRPTQSEVLYTQVIGRGTRALPGVIDSAAGDATARRAAIEASAKPSLLVIDFTTNSRRHDLVTALTILAGDESEQVQRAAEAELAKDPALTVDKALERARKRAEADAKRKEEEDARRRTEAQRAHVRAKAKTITFNVDFDRDAFIGVNAHQVRHLARVGCRELSDKQKALLEKAGYAASASTDDGRAIDRARFNKIIERVTAGSCTLKQAQIVSRYGLDPNMSMQAASKALDAIAGAKWHPSEALLAQLRATCLPREPGSEG